MDIELGISQTALAGIGLLFGLLLGSFLNVVILRLPAQLKGNWRRDSRDFLGLEPETEESVTIVAPASRCPVCKKPIKLHHNIPLFSYLFLKGRCKFCSAPISIQYPLVELLAGLLAAYFAYQYGLSSTTFYSLIFSYSLLVLAGIDIHEKLLPDQITLPLMWLGLFANLSGTFVSLNESVIGAIAGYLSLWSVFWTFKLITGKEGMGYGDFKLLAALGAWMGWHMLPMIILLSTATGAIVGIAGIVFIGRNKEMPMAFGPFLAAAGWIAFVWGDQILSGYLSLFNF